MRPYNGKDSRWYKAAIRRKAGRISAAGMTKEVTFEPADESMNGRIDDAYRTKYASSSYLASTIAPRIRAATVRINPR